MDGHRSDSSEYRTRLTGLLDLLHFLGLSVCTLFQVVTFFKINFSFPDGGEKREVKI